MKIISLIFCLVFTASLAHAADKGKNKTPAEVFAAMRGSFKADKAKDAHIRYQFNLSGKSGGIWWITVDDGKFKLGRGKIEKPDVTFEASDEDWVAMSNDEVSGTDLFLKGRLHVLGNAALAQKLDEIFP